MYVEMIKVETLIPYARNAKLHSDAQVAAIAASIREFSFNSPVLIDTDNGIIAGHGRVLAARKLGMDEVPCIRLAHLTDAQRRAYILADNRLGEIGGGWDDELLRVELASLRDDFDLDPTLTGFNADDLARLLAAPDDVEEIEASADEMRSGADVQYLAIGKARIPLDDDEFRQLKAVLDDYVEQAGTPFGFGSHLLARIAA